MCLELHVTVRTRREAGPVAASRFAAWRVADLGLSGSQNRRVRVARLRGRRALRADVRLTPAVPHVEDSRLALACRGHAVRVDELVSLRLVIAAGEGTEPLLTHYLLRRLALMLVRSLAGRLVDYRLVLVVDSVSQVGGTVAEVQVVCVAHSDSLPSILRMGPEVGWLQALALGEPLASPWDAASQDVTDMCLGQGGLTLEAILEVVTVLPATSAGTGLHLVRKAMAESLRAAVAPSEADALSRPVVE